jgi:monofunctional glycosyltransferase
VPGLFRWFRRSRRRSFAWRLIAGFFKIAALLIVLSVFSVIILRWVPPPVTGVMLERRIDAWRQEANYPLDYRWVGWGRISSHAAVAVVAAEDQRFADHRGFDTDSIRDALEEHGRGGRLRGASTISQQVAKNLFLWSGRSYIRKGLEAYFTALIEALWPKRRILEMYLNIAEMGDGVFGVEAASRKYFGKSAAALHPEEAALLAAVLPNPRRLRVERPSSYVEERRAWILRQMRQLGGADYAGRF